MKTLNVSIKKKSLLKTLWYKKNERENAGYQHRPLFSWDIFKSLLPKIIDNTRDFR